MGWPHAQWTWHSWCEAIPRGKTSREGPVVPFVARARRWRLRPVFLRVPSAAVDRRAHPIGGPWARPGRAHAPSSSLEGRRRCWEETNAAWTGQSGCVWLIVVRNGRGARLGSTNERLVHGYAPRSRRPQRMAILRLRRAWRRTRWGTESGQGVLDARRGGKACEPRVGRSPSIVGCHESRRGPGEKWSEGNAQAEWERERWRERDQRRDRGSVKKDVDPTDDARQTQGRKRERGRRW